MFKSCHAEATGKQALAIRWDYEGNATLFRVLWSDRFTENMAYRPVWEGTDHACTYSRSTHIPHYFRIQALDAFSEEVLETGPVFSSEKFYDLHPQLEKLSRGLIAVRAKEGIFLSWRLFRDEVTGYSESGLTGADFDVLKNGIPIARVTDSTNWLDPAGTPEDRYAVVPVTGGVSGVPCPEVTAAGTGEGSLDLPLQKPADGVTPAGETYTYHANDMSVGDVNGDGELEYILKWDPSNSKDVSQKGYTGPCLIDCYTLSGRLLWRLDMGPNIRSGAHYTQFMVYDFNGDGKAEMAVKTAPGTRMTVYSADGSVFSEHWVTLPESDRAAGVTHMDNYVGSAEDYREYLVSLFLSWQDHPEVRAKRWPATIEECLGLRPRFFTPLSRKNAEWLADYFIDDFAPKRSPKNELRKFEGFIWSGPEYLTMFAGDGRELQTIPYPFPRVDDGLLWGDYSWNRIEPCNRVDRFLAGVAYLDGHRPSLLMCRGYYTRTTLAAYDFYDNCFHEVWKIDSGFVPMRNPFAPTPAGMPGSDPVYGIIAGQGNHSLSCADVDGDGCDEILYGACVIDHDGSVLYSGAGYLPDGRWMNWGHGDAMQAAVIDPDRPGLQVMHVFEDGRNAPFGEALVEAETGRPIYGEYCEADLGRCMTGKVDPDARGMQVWVRETRNCDGTRSALPVPGTNASIRWAADLTTQVTDGVDYVHEKHTGIINDPAHGILLRPEGTSTNNGTKGNPCLIADVLGDFRENLLLRLADDSAVRIFVNTEVTHHKLYTMLHDVQYCCGVAWQNNCYNQPVWPSFYYGNDMDFRDVFSRL